MRFHCAPTGLLISLPTMPATPPEKYCETSCVPDELKKASTAGNLFKKADLRSGVASPFTIAMSICIAGYFYGSRNIDISIPRKFPGTVDEGSN